MSLTNNRKSLIAALVTGALVFVIFGSITLKTPDTVQTAPSYQFVVAKTDIKKDDKIKEENVEIKDFQVNIEGTYKATGELIGRVAKQDITAGKPIMQAFIQPIDVQDDPLKGVEPDEGFRAVPLLIKKSSLPPYVATNARFDLFTRENTMKVENLRILAILDTSKDGANKMLLLEIKNEDVPAFIKYQVDTKGFIFLQKNTGEYGEYKFVDFEKIKKQQEEKTAKQTARRTSGAVSGEIPSLKNIPDIEDIPYVGSKNVQTKEPPISGKGVEIIVGNTKSRVEF